MRRAGRAGLRCAISGKTKRNGIERVARTRLERSRARGRVNGGLQELRSKQAGGWHGSAGRGDAARAAAVRLAGGWPGGG